jgi:hypothetical protein
LIEAQNSGLNTFTLDLNHMADWTEEEYHSLLGYTPTSKTNKRVAHTKAGPPEINWVSEGKVT